MPARSRCGRIHGPIPSRATTRSSGALRIHFRDHRRTGRLAHHPCDPRRPTARCPGIPQRHAPWTSVHSRGRRPQTALPVDIHISNLGMLGIDNFTRHQPPEVANLAVGAAPLSTRCRPGSWSDHDQAHPGPRPGVSLIAPGRGPRALDGRWPTQSARPQGHPRRAVLIIILSAGDEPPTLAPQIACITQGTHRGCSEPPGSSGG